MFQIRIDVSRDSEGITRMLRVECGLAELLFLGARSYIRYPVYVSCVLRSLIIV